MYIPDPIELMDAKIERMCDEFDGVHCMGCGKVTDNFFPLTSSPFSPAVCEECAAAEMGSAGLHPTTGQGMPAGEAK